MTQVVRNVWRRSKVTKCSWYVAAVLGLANLVSVLDRFITSVVLVPIKSELGLSDVQLGLVAGVGFALLYSFAALPFGRLADIANRKYMVTGAVVLWTVAAFACSLAGSFWTLFSTRLAVGLGEAALTPAAMSLITAYFHKDQVGRAMSVYLVGASTGGVLALIVGGMLLRHFEIQGGLSIFSHQFAPWQAVFVASSLAGIPAFLLTLTLTEPPRQRLQTARPSLRDALSVIFQIRKACGAHLIFSACVLMLPVAFATWSISFYVRNFSAPVSDATWIAGLVTGVCGVLGQIVGGAATDMLRRRRVRGAPGVVVAAALMIAVPFAALFGFSSSYKLSIIGYALAHAALASGAPAAFSGVQMLVPARFSGTVTAVFITSTALVSYGIGPVAVGFFNDVVLATPDLGKAIFALVVAATSIGIPVALLSRSAIEQASQRALSDH